MKTLINKFKHSEVAFISRKLSTNKKALILGVITLSLIIIGTSFAVWNYTYTSANANAISTGALSIEYLESTDAINVGNVLPTYDSEGMANSNTFDFAITTKASRNIDIGYNIVLEKLSVDTGFTAFQDKDIKIYLTDLEDKAIVSPKRVDRINDDYVIYGNTNKHTTATDEITDNYRLRSWVDSDVDASNWTSATKLQYKFRVNVKTNENNTNLDTSIANAPVLSANMIPVYYDEASETWRKADSTNKNTSYKWYDYNEAMWANAVTVADNPAMDISFNNNSGNAIDVTKSNVATFNGSSSYIKLPSDIGARLPATYSVEFKISSTTNQIIFGDYNTKAALGFYTSNSKVIVSCGGVYTDTFLTGGLELNRYYKFDIVYNSLSDIEVYKDGVPLSKTGSTNYWTWEDTNSYIGRRSTELYFSGALKKFIVYDKALTSSEITSNNNATPGVIGGNNGIIEDDLKLYYDFQNNSREKLINSNAGTSISMEDINTMLVWIPRYKYTVWNYNLAGETTSSPQEIDITFENGTASTGQITCTDQITGIAGEVSELCKQNNANCTDATCNGKTYTHPAFTLGSANLKGIWVGKFEPTGSISNLTIKPDLQSVRNQNVSTFETNIMTMNDTSNVYGFATTTDDTHMMKNQEWGAVAYLSHSKYGKNSEVNINNSSEFYTGRSGGNVGGSTQINGTYTSQTSTNLYNTYGYYTYDGYLLNFDTNEKSSTRNMSKIASTTGNIYGIYDMAGGAHEYTMGNVVSTDGTTMISGYTIANNDHSGYTGKIYDNGSFTNYTGVAYPDNKYLDKYSYGTATYGVAIQEKRMKLGDATKEVTKSGLNWYKDTGYVAYSAGPWFFRGGGYYDDYNAGIFYSYNRYGSAGSNRSARIVLSPLA